MEARLHGLWGRRLAAARDSDEENAGDELRGFAWWFASGKLEPAWSLDQLAAVVHVGAGSTPTIWLPNGWPHCEKIICQQCFTRSTC